jgi:hypothetical protein
VSVCIAALCEQSRCIVAVSDKKVSFGQFSAEHAVLKTEPVWRDNMVLFAGNDVSHATPIIDDAFETLFEGWQKSKKPTGRRQRVPTTNIADAIDAAFQKRLLRCIETAVLRPFGYTVATFKKNGRKECSEEQHAEICRKIDAVHLDGLTIMLAGFSANGEGHIWTIDGINPPHNYDRFGAWAIGSGAKAALSMLSFYQSAQLIHIRSCSVAHMAYCALTAKFMAESASDVGSSTFVTVTRQRTAETKGIEFIHEPSIGKVREQWLEHGAPRLPLEFINTELPALIEPARRTATPQVP